MGQTPISIDVNLDNPPTPVLLQAAGYVDENASLDGATDAETTIVLHRAPTTVAAQNPKSSVLPPKPRRASPKCDPDDPFCKR